MHAVNVVMSAYGASLVQARGQQHFVPIAAHAGAAGIEIRRELFDGSPLVLAELNAAIRQFGLNAVYSAPLELWGPDGVLERDNVQLALTEAAALGARYVKLPLGHYGSASRLPALGELLAAQPVRLLVENDQTAHGGRIAPLQAFFADCRHAGVPVGMTFDMGNWHWTGTDPQAAADALAPYVEYIHCKGVQSGERLRAVPLNEHDTSWRKLLGSFAADIPRGIEFPLQGDDLAGVTRQYIALLASPCNEA